MGGFSLTLASLCQAGLPPPCIPGSCSRLISKALPWRDRSSEERTSASLYHQVEAKAELADNGSVRGTRVIRRYG